MAKTQWNIAFPKCFLKPSSQTNRFSLTYRKVAISIPVYYSIFDHFWGATNQDVLLIEMCYYCYVQKSIKWWVHIYFQSHLLFLSECRILKNSDQIFSIFTYEMHLHDNNKAPSKDFNTLLNGIFKNRASPGKFTKI